MSKAAHGGSLPIEGQHMRFVWGRRVLRWFLGIMMTCFPCMAQLLHTFCDSEDNTPEELEGDACCEEGDPECCGEDMTRAGCIVKGAGGGPPAAGAGFCHGFVLSGWCRLQPCKGVSCCAQALFDQRARVCIG